jgi:membrane protease YdiL (CAAX protease family)
MMEHLSSQMRALAWSALLGLGITVFGAGVWAALATVNLAGTAGIPWSVPAMAVLLWLMWQYLGGRWWPRSTSAARRLCLRANPVSGPVFAWAQVAGGLSLVALAGYWIVLSQLVKMPGNAVPDFSNYPLLTVVLTIGMASLAAPLTEEAAFRGYCQVILERQFRAPAAVIISSILFSLVHGPTQGFLWPKLLVYFFVGVMFGATAHLANSIVPNIPVHFFGLLIFFTLIWPHDGTRGLLAETGADAWFWIHLAQAAVFTVLAILAYVRLAKTARDATAALAGNGALPAEG